MRIACSLLLTSLSALALTAQQPAPQAPIPTLHATARVVVLDVVVNDGHGNPIKGLNASDFNLSEDGVQQTLASFVEHDSVPVATPPAQPNLPANTFSVQPPVAGSGVMSVIVLGNVATLDVPYVLKQFRDYLKASPATMPIAIFRIDTLGLHLVQDFTADHAVLLQAVNSKRMQPIPPAAPYDPNFRRGSLSLRNYLANIPGRVNLIWFSSGGSGGDRSFPDIRTFVDDANKGPTEILQLSRVALYTVDAGGLQAPGLGVNQVRGGRETIQGGSSFLRQGPAVGMTPIFSGGVSGAGFGRQAFNSANLYDANIADMATQTGGRGFYNTNGFKQALDEVIGTTSGYYTISYSPANANWNGAFRKIHIDVPGYSVPTGFTWAKFLGLYDEHKVEYRSGYYARTGPGLGPVPYAGPARAVNAAYSKPGVNPNHRPSLSAGMTRLVPNPQSPLQVAMHFTSPTPTGIHFTVNLTHSAESIKPAKGAALPSDVYLAAPFDAKPYRNIRIHYDIDPADVSFQKKADGTYTDDLQFVAVLYRDDGAEANSISFTAHLDMDAETYARSQTAPLAYDQTIAVPTKGVFFLRAGVEELTTTHIGALQLPTEDIQ